jgi:hypothetical protein
MINLQNYSNGKILAEQPPYVAPIDFRREALVHPVKKDWDWQFKGGMGNLMNTTKGRAIARNWEGAEVRVIKFDGKTRRNEAVAKLTDFCRPRRGYCVCVEFD